MDPATTAALISGGTQLLGGLLGKKKRKAPRVDYVQMRKDAEKAGITMKAALMAGGSQSYSDGGFDEPTLGSNIADALGAGVQTYFNQPTGRDIERDNLEREVMRAELDNIKANTEAVTGKHFGYGIPHATTTSDHNVDFPDALPNGGDLRAFDTALTEDEGFSDAEKYEERWGDLGGSLAGLFVMGADAVKTGAVQARRAVDRIDRAQERYDTRSMLRPRPHNVARSRDGYSPEQNQFIDSLMLGN